MTEQIREQLILFFMAVYTGIAMAFIYDFIRIIRNVKKVNALWIWGQDIFYWIAFVYVAYSLFLKYNFGGIRGYAFLGIILGMSLYFATVSKIFVKYASIIIVKFLNTFIKALKFIWKPIKLGLLLIQKNVNKVIRWHRRREEKRIREKMERQQKESAEEAGRKEKVTTGS